MVVVGLFVWFQWPDNACNWLRPGVIDIEVQLQEAAVDIVHPRNFQWYMSLRVDTSTLRTRIYI